MPTRRTFLTAGLATALPLPALAQAPLSLQNERWRIAITPENLATVVTVGGQVVPVSTGIEPHTVSDLVTTTTSASWTWDRKYKIACALDGEDLRVAITAIAAGDLALLNQPAAAFGRGMAFPLGEGHYVPKGDATWQGFLLDRESEINTTEDLSLPLWGHDHGAFALTWLLLNPFNNTLNFTTDGDGVAVKLTHSFTSLSPTTPMEMLLHLGEDITAGARRYREHLVDTGAWQALADKIAKTPEGAKLIGASHLYLWGDGLIAARDVRDWPMFIATLRGPSPIATQLRAAFEDDPLKDMPAKPQAWQQQALVSSVNQALYAIARKLWEDDDAATDKILAAYPTVRSQFVAAFGKTLNPDIETWGGGLSAGMATSLKKAGLPKLFLQTNGWEGGLFRPEGVAAFVKAGYLIGPYDSYETTNIPGNRPDWITPQLGKAAYDTSGIVRKNGSIVDGFQHTGHYTNTLTVNPILKSRLPAVVKAAGFNALYLDVYASGMVFDDYRPGHEMTQAQNAVADITAMRWVSETLGLPLASEDGNAVTAGGFMIGQGMQSPVMGWGDPDLQKDKTSPYYLGNWYPPDQPGLFFKEVPCKPFYRSLYFAPESRLPLYQSVFHGSVITTNHGSYDNLKFTDAKTERDLAQWLYNTPPLFHLNPEVLAERLPELKKQDAVFRPLHEALALKTMDGFAWLSDDRLIQQTTFSDGSRLIVNFDTKPRQADGHDLPPQSLTALLAGQPPEVHKA